MELAYIWFISISPELFCQIEDFTFCTHVLTCDSSKLTVGIHHKMTLSAYKQNICNPLTCPQSGNISIRVHYV